MSLKRETRLDIQLHHAAMKGDPMNIAKVLETGRVHVDCRDLDGTTPLMFSVAQGHYDCIQELLDQGADPNLRRFETGAHSLFLASQNGDIDTVRLLLKHGAIVDQPNLDGGTALIIASQLGHETVVRELLAVGASPHYSMKERTTPLFVSAQNGHCNIVRLLLNHGAVADCKRSDKCTPLFIAAQMGWDDVCECLLEHGGAYVDSLHNGTSALVKASQKGFVNVVRVILRHKPNLGLLPIGESALHLSSTFGHYDIVKLLVKAGANPNLVNQNGETSYDLAVNNNYIKVADFLQKVITTNAIKINGTPL